MQEMRDGREGGREEREGQFNREEREGVEGVIREGFLP